MAYCFFHRFSLVLFPIISVEIILSSKSLAIVETSLQKAEGDREFSVFISLYNDLVVSNILRSKLIYILPLGHKLPQFSTFIVQCGSNESPVAYRISMSNSLSHQLFFSANRLYFRC